MERTAVQYLLMQLASCESTRYKAHAEYLVSKMSSMPELISFRDAAPGYPSMSRRREKLRICWVSGDLDYHPVSRFLLGMFSSSKGKLTHHHEIISTQKTSPASLINSFANNCGIKVLQLSGFR